jgi:G3E family GTPase
VKQAAVADRLVLTKSDLLGDAGTDMGRALQARLGALNPGATVIEATAGDIPAASIIGLGPFDVDGKIADVRQWLRAEAVTRSEGEAHGHDDGPAHGGRPGHVHHDVNRHDERIRAFALTSDAPIRHGAFDMFLDLLRSAHGPKLLRVKGLVGFAEDPDRPVVIHGVQHVFHVPAVLPRWPDADRRTRLVFIVQDLDKAVVERLWDVFSGPPRVDQPDAAALADNPLALRR